jgi:hypothetical protein
MIPSRTAADLDERARQAISRLPADIWEPALDIDGKPRADAHVAELTGLLRASAGPDGQVADKLQKWPGDLRVIVRREPIPAGMQVSLFEQHDGLPVPADSDQHPGRATAAAGGPPSRPRPGRDRLKVWPG